MLNKIRSTLSSPAIWNGLIGMICIAGIAAVIYATVWGAALSDDSYFYISTARNLLAGKGFGLTSHFPPVLPLLLTAIGIFKFDPIISIRWLNALLFALNIYLVARVVYLLTRSRLISLIGGVFMLISTAVIVLHSWAMSEPLFVMFALVGIVIIARRQEQGGWTAPILSGIAWGLAAGTRYVGIALLLAGGIYWLFERGRDFRIRLRNALIFSIVGIIPLFLWMVRNLLLVGRPTSRIFAVHLIPSGMWFNLIGTSLRWFLPGRLVNNKESIWLAGGIALLIAWLLFYILSRRRGAQGTRSNPRQKPINLILLMIVSYLFILVVSRSFLDERIPMDDRLLSPILVLVIPLILWAFYRLWEKNKRVGVIVITVLSLSIFVTNFTRSIQTVQSYHTLGRGYASARDHISETYAYLRNRPNTPIYSNASAAIYFWTGRVTFPIPQTSGLSAMKANMKETGAFLVIFDSIPVELYRTTNEELTQGLVEQIRLSEATIYRSP